MIATPRSLHTPLAARYLCVVFTLLMMAGSAAGARTTPAATSRVYLPVAAFRTCHAPTAGFYCLVDLGTLGQTSQATGINQYAEVVGNIFVPAGIMHGVIPHAARARSGVLTELSITAPYTESSALAINDSGLVVGDNGNRAYSWNSTTGLQLLDVAPEPQSFALGVNNAGTIIGMQSPNALLWKQNQRTLLPTLPGAAESVAYDINNLDQIVGTATSATTHPNGVPVTRAVLWQSQTPQALDAPSGYLGGRAQAINDAGQVAGSLYVNESDWLGYYRSHAAVWRPDGWQDLGTLVAHTSSGANDINSQGQIVGSSDFVVRPNAVALTHAVLWQNDTLIDLNTRIVGGNDWELTSAVAINANGVIVGQAQRGQEQHAVELIPAH